MSLTIIHEELNKENFTSYKMTKVEILKQKLLYRKTCFLSPSINKLKSQAMLWGQSQRKKHAREYKRTNLILC